MMTHDELFNENIQPPTTNMNHGLVKIPILVHSQPNLAE